MNGTSKTSNRRYFVLFLLSFFFFLLFFFLFYFLYSYCFLFLFFFACLLACLLFLDNERLARAWAATYRGVKELQNVLRVGKTNEKKGRYHGHRTRVYGQKNGYACAALREQSSLELLRMAVFLSFSDFFFFFLISLYFRSRASAASACQLSVDLGANQDRTAPCSGLRPGTGWTAGAAGTTSAPRNVPHAITETIDVDTH